MNNRLNELVGDDATPVERSASESPIPRKSSATKRSWEKTLRSKKPKLGSLFGKKKNNSKLQVVKQEEDARGVTMKSFYGNVETLQSEINEIESTTKQIQAMTEQITFGTLSSQEEKQLDASACSLVNATNQKAQTVRSGLRLFQEETHKLQNEAPVLLTESDLRIRSSMVSALTRKFIDEIRIYQDAQKDYKKSTTQKFQRQIRFVEPNITDEQVESLIRSREDRDSLWQELILERPGAVNQRIQDTHHAVSEKHNVILQIEESVAVVQRMFLEMALLVEEQGLQLDRIEFDVHRANDYAEEGNKDLHESNKLQKPRMKKLAAVNGLVAVGFILLVALL